MRLICLLLLFLFLHILFCLHPKHIHLEFLIHLIQIV